MAVLVDDAVHRWDVAMKHVASVHGGHSRGQRGGEGEEGVDSPWPWVPCQVRATPVREDEGSRIKGRVQELRNPRQAPEPCQDLPLVDQPAARPGSDGLLADDRAPVHDDATDAGALAVVHEHSGCGLWR